MRYKPHHHETEPAMTDGSILWLSLRSQVDLSGDLADLELNRLKICQQDLV